jgi:hypothetical protein
MWLMGWLMSVGTDACMRVHEMLQGIRGAGPAAGGVARGPRRRRVSYVEKFFFCLTTHRTVPIT